ncbi:MAG: Penicillinase repressor [Gemmatimonadaceae bacterium]|nr:Penicillinase repressor [Gemmatimonadaceae bacterium]
MMDADHSTLLTDLQLAVVRALWARGECTVIAVQQALWPDRPLAQTTIATLLARLEKRGVVSHRAQGRQFVYRALVTEPEVKGAMVGQLMTMLFAGRPTALISHLLTSRDVRDVDLVEIKRLVEEAEARSRTDTK